MRLLGPEHFAEIFEPLRGRSVGLVEAGGNAGDLMIHRATRQLCDHFGVRWTVWDGAALDRLLIFGGGNMGSPYEEGRRIRRAAIESGIPCDQLPQSWMALEDSGCDRTFVREQESLELVSGGILAPDLALGMEFERPQVATTHGTEWFLRIDGESVFSHYPPHDPTRYARTIADYLALAARFEHVVTDRLHFAIAALMAGRRVTLLPNSYHKNRSMWETWLERLGCEWRNT